MIRLGYAYGHYGSDRAGLFDSVLEQARAAEDAGYDSVWVPDHLMQATAVAPIEEPMLECYTTLGALAAVTSTVRLGAFVGCPTYRSAALLGKILTTLDVISGGRAIFAIGAGWYETEHAAYGFDDLGHHGERYERMVETIEIVRSMFVNETTTYNGKHFRAEAALNSPRPVQSGGLPLMIAGAGEKKTLRLVAEHADLCNVLGSPETVRHLMSVLDNHCADVGRDPASICRTVLCTVVARDTEAEAVGALPPAYRDRPSPLRPVAGTPEQVVEQLGALFDAGADALILNCRDGDATPEYIAGIADLARQARAWIARTDTGRSTLAEPNLAVRDYFTDESLLSDPFPYYEAVRAHGPVWREPNHGAFLVTGYDEIFAVFRDADAFSSCNAFAGPFPALPGGPHGDDVSALIEQFRDVFAFNENFITFDPPEHTKHRGLVMRQLSPIRLQENEQFMWRAADEELDGFADRGVCEFVTEYAQPFSMLIIADLLGVPMADRGALRQRIRANVTPGAVGQPPAESLLEYLEESFTNYIEDRRRHPRDDVLTQMAHARFPDGSLPDVIDVVRVAAILFAGGQGTAARFLISVMRLLAEVPDLQQQLRADRSHIPDFVEEVLRFRSPTKVSFRMARRTCELGGVTVPAGSTLILLLSAGDRDPRAFECPAEFHLDRANPHKHIAFGRGVHSCPGAPLVRAEGRITLERVLDRIDDIRISEADHGPPDARRFDMTQSFILLGVDALHLEFRPRRDARSRSITSEGR